MGDKGGSAGVGMGGRKGYVRLGPRGPATPELWEVRGCVLGGFPRGDNSLYFLCCINV